MATGRRPDGGGDGPHIIGEGVQAVVAVSRPFAVAVAPLIDGVGPPPFLGQDRCRRAPGVAGLAAAVQEHHGSSVGSAIDVGHQGDAVPGEADGLRRARH